MKAGMGTPTQIHPGHQRFQPGITRHKPCASCEVKTDFPTILLDLISSELFHLELAYRAKSTHQLQAAIQLIFPHFFLHKEPDKATERSSMSASPKLPWAAGHSLRAPMVNTSPDPQWDTAAMPLLWGHDGYFVLMLPMEKQTNTHTPSDSPITRPLLGGGKPHPASRNHCCVQAGTESTRYPALPQTSSSALGKSLHCHNLGINGREMHEYFSICSR